MIYIGIDPGFEGAIAHYDAKLDLAAGIPMPITGTGKTREISMEAIALHLRALQSPEQNMKVFLEKAQAVRRKKTKKEMAKSKDKNKMTGMGLSTTFKFAMGYGQIMGILSTMRVPYTLVRPQAWKELVLAGLPWKGNKAASIQFCQKQYPEYNLFRTTRCTTPHDGLADALCLAHYGRLTYGP